MNLNKKILTFNLLLVFVIFFETQFSYSQEDGLIAVQDLDEVVVTGQINPQAVDKSIFEVKVISQKEIQLRAGNTLADILNQTLNINVIPDTNIGKSGVQLFGLDAQYFKVLIDNIPVVNEEGFGNNIDLTLINLDDVERIEIVEGAMGVQYGANALSGIINIITKKGLRENTKVSIFIQEETVGDEYELFNEGRHVQSLSISHNFNKNFFVSSNFFRNDFAGYWSNYSGEIYDANDGQRGYAWLPKNLNNAKLLFKYSASSNFKVVYKFDFLNEIINSYNNVVNLNPNAATATSNPFALDELFENNRFIHIVNANGKLGNQLNYDVSLSYQEQTKDFERYTFYIRPKVKEPVFKTEFSSRKSWFSRGTLNNILKSSNFNLQTGYELGVLSGSQSSLFTMLSSFNDEMQTQQMQNYDVFASSEYKLSEKWQLKPGARVSLSNLFSPQYMFSLSALHNLKNDYEWRTVIGTSNRIPTYTELYVSLVDVNHTFLANPNLDPEYGYSIFTHLKKQFDFKNYAYLKSKLSMSYINVNDRIESIIVNTIPRVDEMNNIDSYRYMGVFFENTYSSGPFIGTFNIGYQGISKELESSPMSNDDFLFNIQLNTNFTYTYSKWNTSATLYFKHIGSQQQFYQAIDEQGELVNLIGKTDPISWLDASFKTDFLDKKFILTIGARNLLDIDSVNTSTISGGSHNNGSSQIQLAYGRSYFLKLNYNLSI